MWGYSTRHVPGKESKFCRLNRPNPWSGFADIPPVVLAKDDERAWLDPELTAPAQVLAILSRSAGVPLDAYPVSRMVNKATVEGKELIRPVA